ncbi:hypothetical protein [Fredinandcohnia sp. 179-A 10B2 NHS]|uniref:hypothetical protein n=1 Tax=Fredinandcohnia sp. 179-A 10B2 NHS TaxID=3235176 RepID=UPI00399F2E2C
MSQIKVKVDNVRSTNNSVKSSASTASKVAGQISSVSHSIDSEISSRRGIHSRINQSVRAINDIEKRLNEIYSFIDVSMDSYVSADKTAKSREVPGTEKKSAWDRFKEGFGAFLDGAKGFGKGLWDSVVSTVEGIWNAITHPIETIKGIIHVITNPIDTAKAVWDAIKTSWNEDVINGDAESRGNWFGRAFGDIALALVGTKGVDKAVKMIKANVQQKKGGVHVTDGSDTKISGISDNAFRNQIDTELKKHGLTINQFNELKLKPVAELTDKEVSMMKEIRDAVAPITRDTQIQKTIPAGDIEKYLSGTYAEIGGYVAKLDDVGHIKSYDDVVESSRLDYTSWDGSRPFPENGETYGKIVFTSDRVDNIDIPYGERFGGDNTDGPPCTLNGFTASRNGEVIPEFRFDGRYLPEDGAELYAVTNGVEQLVGVFDAKLGRFVPVE